MNGFRFVIGMAICVFGAQHSIAENARPNILFIITDQQSASMMSCTGNPNLKTPAMDRLAAGGMRFDLAYTTHPVCLPARFSLFTGHMPSEVGITRNETGKQPISKELMANTMGRVFRSAGYETAYGGKTHLPPDMTPEKMGFDFISQNRRQGLVEICKSFLSSAHRKPFLLVASLINPHDICYMAINDYRRSIGEPIHTNEDSRVLEALIAEPMKDLDRFVAEHCPQLPENFEVPKLEPECITTHYVEERPFRAFVREHWSDNMWRLHRWAYARLTELVDREVGEILDALESAGLEESTLVVLTSEHGDHSGAHRLEHKSILYEESLRVPFLIRYPGVIPAGQVDTTHLVSNGLDLLPTLCDFAGIAIPGGLLGQTLRPLLTVDSPTPWRDHLGFESQNGRAIRTQRFKYCVYENGAHREQLNDLENDPGEMVNLAYDSAYAQEVARHRSLLVDWSARTRDVFRDSYRIQSVSEVSPALK